jgi:chromosome partitioning protein
LAAIALHYASHILIPVQTEYKSWMGTNFVLKTVADFRRRSNPGLKIKGFIPTMYNSGTSQHVRALGAIKENLSQFGQVFPAIPQRTAFVNASENHEPLMVFQPKCDAVSIMDEVCDRIIAKEFAHV